MEPHRPAPTRFTRPPVAHVSGRFLARPVTGVERYAREVTARLEGNLGVLRSPPWARGVSGHLWEQCVLPRIVPRHGVLWSPANSGPIVAENHVVTIHDAGPIDHPEWFRTGFARWYRFLVPRLVRRARFVITSSRFSRDRLMEIGGIPEGRVVIVTPGVDTRRFHFPSPRQVEEVRRRYALPEHYLLAVGSRSRRKNLEVLVSAWRLLRPRHPRLGLVIAGDPAYTARTDGLGEGEGGIRLGEEEGGMRLGEEEGGIRLGGEEGGVRLLGRVPDPVLPPLYGAAAVFVYPSRYEGFGLPVLEAMACGAPVVASNRSGVPEAVGEAGALFDPDDPEELALAIEDLLEDPHRRRFLVARGARRAAKFTWERTASQVLEVLTQARP